MSIGILVGVIKKTLNIGMGVLVPINVIIWPIHHASDENWETKLVFTHAQYIANVMMLPRTSQLINEFLDSFNQLRLWLIGQKIQILRWVL